MPQPVRIKVLIAHSDPLISAGLAATLRKRPDFEVVGCTGEPAFAHAVHSRFPHRDVVVADYESALLLIASKDGWRDRVMILTHRDGEAKIYHALEQGARGYLLLGCRLKDLTESLRSMHVGGIALGPLVTTRMAEWLKQEALTRREAEILGEMMFGLCNKQIASNLALAVGTVKAHVKSILNKLHAAGRTEAVAIAQRRGILGEEREWRHREPWARRPIKRPDLDRRAVMAREFMGQPDSRGGACDISADAA
jgi:DNA-binding NarL/FixJ family response regulator